MLFVSPVGGFKAMADQSILYSIYGTMYIKIHVYFALFYIIILNLIDINPTTCSKAYTEKSFSWKSWKESRDEWQCLHSSNSVDFEC